MKVDGLRGKLTETARDVPTKNRAAFSEAVQHLDHSLRAYTVSLTYWKPEMWRLAEAVRVGKQHWSVKYRYVKKDEYRELTIALPGLSVPATHVEEYTSDAGRASVPAVDLYDKKAVFHALWDYAGKEVAKAGQLLDTLDGVKR